MYFLRLDVEKCLKMKVSYKYLNLIFTIHLAFFGYVLFYRQMVTKTERKPYQVMLEGCLNTKATPA